MADEMGKVVGIIEGAKGMQFFAAGNDKWKLTRDAEH